MFKKITNAKQIALLDTEYTMVQFLTGGKTSLRVSLKFRDGVMNLECIKGDGRSANFRRFGQVSLESGKLDLELATREAEKLVSQAMQAM